MNNKKIIIIILSILVVIAALVLTFVLLEDYIPQKQVIIPENEELQVSILKNIYEEILSKERFENGTVILDESAIQNLVTKEKFSDESIAILNEITSKFTGESTKYTVYSKYNNGFLQIKICEYVNPLESRCTYEEITSYSLEYKNNTLTYTPDGLSTSTFTMHAP